MPDITRWGILGTGSIAHKFAAGLTSVTDATLAAVGSRAQETADAFGDEFDVANRHSTYEALAQDPNVDAIYVSTPHPFHQENTILCLEAGKAVLCEKPFAINAEGARRMMAVAKDNGVFLMEAMWTRFVPLMVEVRKIIVEGRIGEVRMCQADFGFRAGINPEGRLFDPALGGGALLDVGVYPVSFASMVMRKIPTRVTGFAEIGETGVDEQAGMVLGYGGGEIAVLSTAVRTNTSGEARIWGTEGKIEIGPRFWCPDTAELTVGGDIQTLNIPYEGNGYNYEAMHVAECLREGKTESDVLTLGETITIMETMDGLRGKWGLKYPME